MDFHNGEATGLHLHVGRVTQYRVQAAEEWVIQQEDRRAMQRKRGES